MENIIIQTITRMRSSSVKQNDPGERYARLLAVLWGTQSRSTALGSTYLGGNESGARAARSGLRISSIGDLSQRESESSQSDDRNELTTAHATNRVSQQELQVPEGSTASFLASSAFSWRDLEKIGQYATSRIDQADAFVWPELFGNADGGEFFASGNELFPESDQWEVSQQASF